MVKPFNIYEPIELKKEAEPYVAPVPFTQEEYEIIRQEMILIQNNKSKQNKEQRKRIKRLYNSMEKYKELMRMKNRVAPPSK